LIWIAFYLSIQFTLLLAPRLPTEETSKIGKWFQNGTPFALPDAFYSQIQLEYGLISISGKGICWRNLPLQASQGCGFAFSWESRCPKRKQYSK
jgi:hypothetical protein